MHGARTGASSSQCIGKQVPKTVAVYNCIMTLSPAPLGFMGAAVGSSELLLVFAVVLLLFGPRELPRVARMLGKLFNDLREASGEFRDQLMSIDQEPASSRPRLPPADSAQPPGDSRETETRYAATGSADAGPGDTGTPHVNAGSPGDVAKVPDRGADCNA